MRNSPFLCRRIRNVYQMSKLLFSEAKRSVSKESAVYGGKTQSMFGWLSVVFRGFRKQSPFLCASHFLWSGSCCPRIVQSIWGQHFLNSVGSGVFRWLIIQLWYCTVRCNGILLCRYYLEINMRSRTIIHVSLKYRICMNTCIYGFIYYY